MAVRRWDPFTVLARLDDDFDSIVRRSLGAAPGRTVGWVPPIDMVSEGSDVLIALELPGVSPSDVDIEVHEGRLTISGERRSQHEERSENGKILVRELRYGSFRRDFVLPEGVGADAVTADYDRGVLTVRVAGVTRAPAEPQKIEVKDRTAISTEAHDVEA